MHRARGERGQVLLVATLARLGLLGIAAFAVDVGYACLLDSPSAQVGLVNDGF